MAGYLRNKDIDAVFDQGPAPDPPAAFNLSAYVLAQADRLADKTALRIVSANSARVWTYAQLKRAVLGTATGLLGHGLAPGDRLLMRLSNSVDFPIVFLAAIAVGIVPVPTSPLLGRREISDIAADLAPAAVVAAPKIALPDPARCPVLSLNDLREMRALAPARYLQGDPDRAAYIIFSSGTSGRARGVIHAHRAVWARRMMWRGWSDLRSDDRLLHAGALNWTYSLGTGLLDPWAAGASALIPADGVASADLADLLHSHRATIFAAVPGVFRQMLAHPIPPLPDLRHALSAGEKLPDPVREKWQKTTGTEIHEAFGMSECSTFISSSPARPAPPGTLGYPQPGRRVAIRTDTGFAQTDQPGMIAVAADDPGLMLGYLQGQQTDRGDIQDGWFLTGDLGRIDATGAISYLGRQDDMMNAQGYLVSPVEVETAIRSHPDVTDCAAVLLPVKDDTQVIAVFFTAARRLDTGPLLAHAASRLARYKQPRIFHQLDTLPRSANGKLQRRRLRLPDADGG